MQSQGKKIRADDSCFYDLGCFIWMAKQWSQQIAVWKCFHFVKTVCSHNTLLKKQRQTLFYLPYIKALRQYGKNNGPLPLHYFLHCHNFQLKAASSTVLENFIALQNPKYFKITQNVSCLDFYHLTIKSDLSGNTV